MWPPPDFNMNNLEDFWVKTGKKKAEEVVKPDINLIAQQKQMKAKVQDVNLKLTEELQFSMTNFDKLNKGCINTMQINCYMNVCL